MSCARTIPADTPVRQIRPSSRECTDDMLWITSVESESLDSAASESPVNSTNRGLRNTAASTVPMFSIQQCRLAVQRALKIAQQDVEQQHQQVVSRIDGYLVELESAYAAMSQQGLGVPPKPHQRPAVWATLGDPFVSAPFAPTSSVIQMPATCPDGEPLRSAHSSPKNERHGLIRQSSMSSVMDISRSKNNMRHMVSCAQEEAKRLTKARKGSSDHLGRKKAVFADVGSKQQAVLFDAETLKEKIKLAVLKPEYNVAQFYKTTGWAQAVAKHHIFESLTMFIIGLNSIWIALDTDRNPAPTLMEAHWVFQVGENAFCVYFSGELFIRAAAFKRKRNGFKDGWFAFDFALVAMMVVETWIMNLVVWIIGGSSGGLGNASILRLVRLLRLTRMARMARLLRAMPELMVLVKGMAVATRSVIFTLVLLAIVVYVFAIGFTQMMADTSLKDEYFRTVPESMSTLLLKGTLPDFAQIVEDVGREHPFYAVCMLIFILFSSLTILNMLVGVLCEVVSVVSSVEKEQMTVQFVKSKLLFLIEKYIDHDQNQSISRQEFEALIVMPEGAQVIQEVGVDVVGLVDFFDHIFKEDKELSFSEVFELILQLRGTNKATVRDIVELRKFLIGQFHTTEASLIEQVCLANMQMQARLEQLIQRAAKEAVQLAITDALESTDSVV